MHIDANTFGKAKIDKEPSQRVTLVERKTKELLKIIKTFDHIKRVNRQLGSHFWISATSRLTWVNGDSFTNYITQTNQTK